MDSTIVREDSSCADTIFLPGRRSNDDGWTMGLRTFCAHRYVGEAAAVLRAWRLFRRECLDTSLLRQDDGHAGYLAGDHDCVRRENIIDCLEPRIGPSPRGGWNGARLLVCELASARMASASIDEEDDPGDFEFI